MHSWDIKWVTFYLDTECGKFVTSLISVWGFQQTIVHFFWCMSTEYEYFALFSRDYVVSMLSEYLQEPMYKNLDG
jgi:hypothetical protein